jgi:hypothetical protein
MYEIFSDVFWKIPKYFSQFAFVLFSCSLQIYKYLWGCHQIVRKNWKTGRCEMNETLPSTWYVCRAILMPSQFFPLAGLCISHSLIFLRMTECCDVIEWGCYASRLKVKHELGKCVPSDNLIHSTNLIFTSIHLLWCPAYISRQTTGPSSLPYIT